VPGDPSGSSILPLRPTRRHLARLRDDVDRARENDRDGDQRDQRLHRH